MYRIILLSAFLLAACAPAGSYDPELAAIDARAKADALSEQATIVASRTQVAIAEATRVAELDLAQRNQAAEKEIELIEARAAERREAVILQVTEQAVWSAATTATAAPAATMTAYPATQAVLAVTQQAMERQVRIDQSTEQRAKVMVWALPTAIVLAVLFVAWKIGAHIDKKTAIMEYNSRVRESRMGTLALEWVPELGDYLWTPLPDSALTRRLNAHSDFPVVDAVELSRGGVTATSAPGNGDRQLVAQLVQDAIRSAGEGSKKIPGWRDLAGWNSRQWSKAVGQLAKAGVVETVEREGTYLRRFDSLADLSYALETNQLSPTPR